jgi:hypothetical protein
MQKDVDLLQTIQGVSRQVALLSFLKLETTCNGSPIVRANPPGLDYAQETIRARGKSILLKTTLVEEEWVATPTLSKASPLLAIKHQHITTRRAQKNYLALRITY